MGRIFGWITGIKLPSAGTLIVIGVVLFILGSVGFLSYDYSQRGSRIEKLEGEISGWENEKKIWIKEQLAISNERDSVATLLRAERLSHSADSVNYAQREAQMQLTIRQVLKKSADDKAELVADRDYWKDYADKLESGDYEVKMGVWPFRGKKLVKKKEN
ncbi:MAG: hypothetical protein Q8K92_08110 [Leadbetterella sp.]|nr:hypothetical protein [Leadbetterella sp.]